MNERFKQLVGQDAYKEISISSSFGEPTAVHIDARLYTVHRSKFSLGCAFALETVRMQLISDCLLYALAGALLTLFIIFLKNVLVGLKGHRLDKPTNNDGLNLMKNTSIRSQQSKHLLNVIKEKNFLREIIVGDIRKIVKNVRCSINFLNKNCSNLSRQQLNHLSEIHHGMSRLNGLVSNIFNITKIKSKVTYMQLRKIDLSPILKKVLENHLPATVDKSLQLETDIQARTYIMGDVRSLHEVFDQLMSHTIQLSPHGRTLTIKTVKKKMNY